MIGRIEETSASFEARSAPRSYPTTSGLGCVKTPKLNLRIEISSRLHQFKKKRWRPLSGEDNRENNSAPSSRADVFTQPRSFATDAFGTSFNPGPKWLKADVAGKATN